MNRKSINPIASLAGVLLTATLLPAPSYAVDECGPGPVVSCSGNYSPGGVTYNFTSDLTFNVSSGLNAGAGGINLNGSGGANLSFHLPLGTITSTPGVRIVMGTGNVNALFAGVMTTGHLQVNTGGRATIDLSVADPNAISNSRMAGVTAEAGLASTLHLGARRELLTANLTSRTGGSWTITNGGLFGPIAVNYKDAVALTASGPGQVLFDNSLIRGRIRGNFNLSALTGDFTLINDNSMLEQSVPGGWNPWGVSQFGAGDVEIINGHRGDIATVGLTTFDFSASRSSQMVNQGTLRLGISAQGAPALQDLTLKGLEHFHNSGLILMGIGQVKSESDRQVRTRLIFEGTDFVGSGSSMIEMEASLAEVQQNGCTAAVSADCVLFIGGSTDGITHLRVRDRLPTITNAAFNDGIVLIDGSSAEGHFVLDPSSQYYTAHTSGGAGMQKGLVSYHLEYDAAAKQHKLVGTLADEAVQASTYAATVQNIWRTTAETWFDRQETLRSDEGGGFNPHGVWGSLNVASGKRDLQRTLNVAGTDVDYNVDQDEQISHLALGVDFLRGASGDAAWNIGFTAGYVHALSKYDATQLESEIAGFATGIYGAVVSGPLSVDAMINYNMLTQSIDGKNMGLGSYNKLSAEIEAIGARVDAGWKLAVNSEFWVQPLVSASYVTAKRDGIELSDGGHALNFEDSNSARAGLGLRTALDTRLLGVKSQLMLTGRWWTELGAENESTAYIPNGNTTALLTDDFSGSFAEVVTGLKLSNESGALSGYVNLKNKFGEDHSSTAAGLGVSYHW